MKTGLMLALVALLAAVLYFVGGIGVHRSSGKERDAISRNVVALQARESREMTDIDTAKRERYKQMLKACGGILVDDLAAEQQKIITMTEDPSKAQLLQWFSDAAIVGDSIIKSMTAYGWLDESIGFGKVGARVSDENEMILAAIRKQPSVMFLCFGTNDIAVYESRSDIFIDRYRKALAMITEKLPNTVVYVNNILPSTAKKDYYQYRDEYNSKLKALCDEMDVFYLDTDFILLNRPELIDGDSIHPKKQFFPKWLNYLADIAGLSNEQ